MKQMWRAKQWLRELVMCPISCI